METPDHFPTDAPEERRAYWRQRGISLEHQFGWPLSWGLLSDETEALERLGRFVREYNVGWPSDDVRATAEIAGETIPRLPSVDEEGLKEQALRVTARVQRELARLQGVPVNDDPRPWLRWEVAKARWVAIDALFYGYGTNEDVKRAQAEAAAPGPPLAICVGKGLRLVELGSRSLEFAPQGCYTVFEDAPFGRGDMWPHWCEVCQRRKPGRDQERAFVREERAYARQRAHWLRIKR